MTVLQQLATECEGRRARELTREIFHVADLTLGLEDRQLGYKGTDNGRV